MPNTTRQSIFIILQDYEDLEADDIYAVLAFAKRLSQVKRLQPLHEIPD